MSSGEDRGANEQSGRRLRVSSTYDDDLFEKLDRLACAIGISPTTLQTELVKLCLSNENIINAIQDMPKYKRKARFRIIPSKVDGEIKFVFAEKLSKRKG
jgi:hypothetical protein